MTNISLMTVLYHTKIYYLQLQQEQRLQDIKSNKQTGQKQSNKVF